MLEEQRARGAAVLFSTHEPQFAARVADRTVVLRDGRVCTG
jgi:ABC-type glutathione transport system ATPase component